MRRSAVLPLLLLASLPGAARGQSVLDWPLLAEARPAPLVGGAAGVLGNPAALAQLPGRAHGLVADLETPEAMGLRAVSVAGAVRVLGPWTVGAAYRHVGVGDMIRTDGPPLGGALDLEVAEDVYAVGVATRALGLAEVGVAVRLDTPGDDLVGDPHWEGVLGVAAAPPLPLPRVSLRTGATASFDAERTLLAAAIEAAVRTTDRLDLALAYGADQVEALGWAHSVVASAVWDRQFEMQAGYSAQPGSGDSQWVPVLAAVLHLGRYRLGAVREHLPNGFGAAMHYQLGVAF